MTVRFFTDNGTEFYEAFQTSFTGHSTVEVNIVDDQIRNAFPKEYAEFKQSDIGEIPTLPDGEILRGIN